MEVNKHLSDDENLNEDIELDLDEEEAQEELDKIEPLNILNDENIASDTLQLYFKNISKYSPLSQEDELALGEKIKKGDKEAVKKLVLANLKFVVSVANKYKNTGVPLPDLINQGNIGLMEAAKRFDPDKNVKFITYAVWWIRQAIIHGLSEQMGAVRLPIKQAHNLYKINSARERLTKELSHEPTYQELSKATGISEDDISNIMRVSKNNLSLDAPMMENDEGKSYLDALEDHGESVEDKIITKTLKHSLDEIMEDLSEREAEIISKRFGLEDGVSKTLEEIGEEMNVSRERVRQLEARALQKLRQKALRKKLNDYLN